MKNGLKRIKILNFQSIRNLEMTIPLDVQFICFLGENGSGKTTILQALNKTSEPNIRVEFFGQKNKIYSIDSECHSVMAMINKIINQFEIKNPKEFTGIVLIDEIESHLHAIAQKELTKTLSDTFPKVQFVVSTHSAICLLGMPKNTAFYKVKRTPNEGTTVDSVEIDLANLTPNLLLTSPLFELVWDNILSVNNEGIYDEETGMRYKTQRELAIQEALRITILEKYKNISPPSPNGD